MLRLCLCAVAVSACAPGPTGDPIPNDAGGRDPLPDAYISCVGAFDVVAPRADLHYDKSLDVYVDESELQGLLELTMTDDVGAVYTWQTETFGPDPDGQYSDRDRYHYELAASHRYQLTVSGCGPIQMITFFTSP